MTDRRVTRSMTRLTRAANVTPDERQVPPQTGPPAKQRALPSPPSESVSTPRTQEVSKNDQGGERKAARPRVAKRGRRVKAEEEKALALQPPPVALLTRMPPEIFISICKYLDAHDLLQLLRVCRLFYNWLTSVDSETTRLIWRHARETTRYLRLPPPEGMDEYRYALLVLTRGCQMCKIRRIHKVYWHWKVRICESCLDANRISDTHARDVERIPYDLLDALPYTTEQLYSRWSGVYFRNFYWKADLFAAFQQYMKFEDDEAREEWLSQLRTHGKAVMDDARIREEEERRERERRSIELAMLREKRVRAVQENIETMVEERNDDGSVMFFRSLLYRCQSFQKQGCNPSPLTDRAWNSLRKKLEVEHAGLLDEHKQQMRSLRLSHEAVIAGEEIQIDIIKRLTNLTSNTALHQEDYVVEGASASYQEVLGCLRSLPSFLHPPKELDFDELLERLKKETEANRSMRVKRRYRCDLCGASDYVLEGLRKHCLEDHGAFIDEYAEQLPIHINLGKRMTEATWSTICRTRHNCLFCRDPNANGLESL